MYDTHVESQRMFVELVFSLHFYMGFRVELGSVDMCILSEPSCQLVFFTFKMYSAFCVRT